MKIIVLSENTTCNQALTCEHGLSLYIEVLNKKILFDMGQGCLFAENAKKLGVDLSSVDYGIVSHGHYDHGGGLEHFFRVNKKAKVFLHQKAFDKHFNNSNKEIGLDSKLKNNSQLVFIKDEFQIIPGLNLYSCNNQPRFCKKNPSGSIQNDDFTHEIYLNIQEKNHVVISGCSHKGVINIVHWLKPKVLVGGFHFKDIDYKIQQPELQFWADELKNCSLSFNTQFYTCHCTGVEQFKILKEQLANNLIYIATGSVIEL